MGDRAADSTSEGESGVEGEPGEGLRRIGVGGNGGRHLERGSLENDG